VNEAELQRIWYGKAPPGAWLRLASGAYRTVAGLRRGLYRAGLLPRYRPPVPVIVVGNVTVGGTGKTPLVIWLARLLRQGGRRPGIVSRGYGGMARTWPQQVRADSDPRMVGDEPVLIARHTGCPMAVGPDRRACARALVDHHDIDCLISDDGLQHYPLARDLEIAVVDGERRLGNGRCLPAGPLREPPGRLHEVDFVVVNGGQARAHEVPMRLAPVALRAVDDPHRTRPLEDLRGQEVDAVAGIGHPGRFFATLRELGARPREHPFPDHHRYAREDLAGLPGPVVMTEKDAVKCAGLVGADSWYLEVTAHLPDEFRTRFLRRLEGGPNN